MYVEYWQVREVCIRLILCFLETLHCTLSTDKYVEKVWDRYQTVLAALLKGNWKGCGNAKVREKKEWSAIKSEKTFYFQHWMVILYKQILHFKDIYIYLRHMMRIFLAPGNERDADYAVEWVWIWVELKVVLGIDILIMLGLG